jgi:H+/Cl- antiporter ClcA
MEGKTMKQTWYKVVLFSLLGVISFCMVAIAFRVFSANELPASFIGACLGAIISAIITQTLLSAQTQTEEV